MNELQIFQNERFNVRVKDVNGEPWFVAADVCRHFGSSNSRSITDRLDADEKGVSKVDTLGGDQVMTIVNEAGLYHMLFTMEPSMARGIDEDVINERIEQLHEFKRWVTHEVLPTIRKHGGYLTEQKIDEILSDPDTIIRLATDLKAKKEQIKALEAQKAILAPKAEFYDAVADSTDTLEMAAVAKILNVGVGRNRLINILKDALVLRSNGTPYQKFVDNGWLRCIEEKYEKPDGSVFIYTKTVVYQKGVDGIRKLLKEKYALGA